MPIQYDLLGRGLHPMVGDLVARNEAVPCWKCREITNALTIDIVFDREYFARVLFSTGYTHEAWSALQYAWAHIGERQPFPLREGHSREKGTYIANHCSHCGMLQGDWPIFSRFIENAAGDKAHRLGMFRYRGAAPGRLAVEGELAGYDPGPKYPMAQDLPFGLWLCNKSIYTLNSEAPEIADRLLPGLGAKLTIGPTISERPSPLLTMLTVRGNRAAVGLYCDAFPAKSPGAFFLTLRDEHRCRQKLAYFDLANRARYISREEKEFGTFFDGYAGNDFHEIPVDWVRQ